MYVVFNNIYLDNQYIQCTTSCDPNKQFLTCCKCIYNKILVLGGKIPFLNYAHISRSIEILKQYELNHNLPLLPNCPDPDKQINCFTKVGAFRTTL